MARHRVGVLLGLVVLVLGQRGLGDEGAQASVVGGLGEEGELLVRHLQLGPQPLQPLGHVGEPALDQPAGHGKRKCRWCPWSGWAE